MNKNVKGINMKNHTYYLFDDNVNIKEFDPNNIKLDQKSYKYILIYYIAYVTIKDSKYVKIYRVNPLYLMSKRINGCFEEINRNKYLTQVPTNESEKKLKKYKKLWIKIRYLIRSLTKKSDDYDE